MSEEEKQAIEILKQKPDYSLDYYRREKAIDIVLKLVDKQQKELEMLKELTTQYNAIGGETFGDDRLILCSMEYFYNGVFKRNFIFKSKIREKIKELKDNEKFEIEQYGFDYAENINLAVNILQELLGDRK